MFPLLIPIILFNTLLPYCLIVSLSYCLISSYIHYHSCLPITTEDEHHIHLEHSWVYLYDTLPLQVWEQYYPSQYIHFACHNDKSSLVCMLNGRNLQILLLYWVLNHHTMLMSIIEMVYLWFAHKKLHVYYMLGHYSPHKAQHMSI